MIKRDKYLDQLRLYRDKQLIKVVSGVRRCGKSTLFAIFQEELKQNGITDKQIISINFEDLAYRDILDYGAAYDYITKKIPDAATRCYIFLDEVQNVDQFERMADSLFIKPNVDLYITGSNAYFMSGELATLLTGRYIEIKMLPLSFAEYVSAFDDKTDLKLLYNNYLDYSSFPQTVDLFKTNPESVSKYLRSIYDTVIFKDVITRKNIKNENILQDIAKFVFDNVGNLTNPNKIAMALAQSGREVSNHTVENHLSALVDSLILYAADRFDMKGKRILQNTRKYYVVDLAFRRLLADSAPTDYGRILENVVYLELLRRFDKVWVGKNGSKEVDFVVQNGNELQYFQVAYSIKDTSVRERELLVSI